MMPGKPGQKKIVLQQDKIMTETSMYRESALNNLNMTSDMQGALKVVEAKSACYMIASIMGLVGIFIWSVYGSVSIEIPAQGMLMSAAQLDQAEKDEGEARKERVASLKTMKDLLDKKQTLYSHRYLSLDDLEKAKREYHDTKTNLLRTQGTSVEVNGLFHADAKLSKQLDALVFVSHTQGKKVAVGMHAYVLPSTMSEYEYGYVQGKVVSVSAYPASKESVYPYLGNMNLVDEFFVGGSPFVVKIELEKDKKSRSGLRWTTDDGAPYRIDQGSMVSAKIVNHQFHPFQLLTRQHELG
jgi:hypothetical protein